MKIYPSVEEIKEKYQSFKTVPVSTEIEADVSALTVLKKLKNVSSHCYMLESNDDANNTGRYTFTGRSAKVGCWMPVRLFLRAMTFCSSGTTSWATWSRKRLMSSGP